MVNFGLLLCRIGLHKWGKAHGFSQVSSNVVEMKQRCRRCGKVKRWIEPYKKPKGRGRWD
jgi:hypothetical protein